MKDAFMKLCDYHDKNIFSKYQCGFRKGFSTQHALLVMIEKIKTAPDNKEFAWLFSQICQKLLTVSVTISSLLN